MSFKKSNQIGTPAASPKAGANSNKAMLLSMLDISIETSMVDTNIAMDDDNLLSFSVNEKDNSSNIKNVSLKAEHAYASLMAVGVLDGSYLDLKAGKFFYNDVVEKDEIFGYDAKNDNAADKMSGIGGYLGIFAQHLNLKKGIPKIGILQKVDDTLTVEEYQVFKEKRFLAQYEAPLSMLRAEIDSLVPLLYSLDKEIDPLGEDAKKDDKIMKGIYDEWKMIYDKYKSAFQNLGNEKQIFSKIEERFKSLMANDREQRSKNPKSVRELAKIYIKQVLQEELESYKEHKKTSVISPRLKKYFSKYVFNNRNLEAVNQKFYDDVAKKMAEQINEYKRIRNRFEIRIDEGLFMENNDNTSNNIVTNLVNGDIKSLDEIEAIKQQWKSLQTMEIRSTELLNLPQNQTTKGIAVKVDCPVIVEYQELQDAIDKWMENILLKIAADEKKNMFSEVKSKAVNDFEENKDAIQQNNNPAIFYKLVGIFKDPWADELDIESVAASIDNQAKAEIAKKVLSKKGVEDLSRYAGTIRAVMAHGLVNAEETKVEAMITNAVSYLVGTAQKAIDEFVAQNDQTNDDETTNSINGIDKPAAVPDVIPKKVKKLVFDASAELIGGIDDGMNNEAHLYHNQRKLAELDPLAGGNPLLANVRKSISPSNIIDVDENDPNGTADNGNTIDSTDTNTSLKDGLVLSEKQRSSYALQHLETLYDSNILVRLQTTSFNLNKTKLESVKSSKDSSFKERWSEFEKRMGRAIKSGKAFLGRRKDAKNDRKEKEALLDEQNNIGINGNKQLKPLAIDDGELKSKEINDDYKYHFNKVVFAKIGPVITSLTGAAAACKAVVVAAQNGASFSELGGAFASLPGGLDGVLTGILASLGPFGSIFNLFATYDSYKDWKDASNMREIAEKALQASYKALAAQIKKDTKTNQTIAKVMAACDGKNDDPSTINLDKFENEVIPEDKASAYFPSSISFEDENDSKNVGVRFWADLVAYKKHLRRARFAIIDCTKRILSIGANIATLCGGAPVALGLKTFSALFHSASVFYMAYRSSKVNKGVGRTRAGVCFAGLFMSRKMRDLTIYEQLLINKVSYRALGALLNEKHDFEGTDDAIDEVYGELKEEYAKTTEPTVSKDVLKMDDETAIEKENDKFIQMDVLKDKFLTLLTILDETDGGNFKGSFQTHITGLLASKLPFKYKRTLPAYGGAIAQLGGIFG